jgi:protein-S-isoprenylcysteine O-methyltransferase Ste14
MSRIFGLVYGTLSYAIGLGSLVYAIFFLNNWLAPMTIDGGGGVALASGAAGVLLINLVLCSLFAVQHSVMARRGFKRALTRLLPAFAERSTYVLFSGLVLVLLYLFWQPMPETIWHVETPAARVALYALQAAGWTLLVAATFMLSHTELFGLSQVLAHAKDAPLPAPRFREPGLYRFVRHPIQLGVLISFWATPDLSMGHLILNAAITGYIVVALRFFEEPDLVRQFGDTYRDYQDRVGMLLPRLRRRAASVQKQFGV